MEIKLNIESATILYKFIRNTNGMYLKEILEKDFDEDFIKELNGVFSEIYNQMSTIR